MKKWKIPLAVKPILTLMVLSLMVLATVGCNGVEELVLPDASGGAQCAPGLKAYKTACIPIFDACKENEVPMPGGGCKRVGVERCEGGIKGPPDWTCKPIGPPTKCLTGWEKVAGGWCEPIVPPKACTGLTMAKIGYRTCQPIMDCGTGKWGNIKTTAATIFVDQTYAGRDSDGSQTKPYTSIATALKKAVSGGHIAVTVGTYYEDLDIDRPVTIEGVCPQKVTIKSLSSEKYATVDVITTDVMIRGVSITGNKMGVVVFSGASAVMRHIAVVGCGDDGVHAQGEVSVRDSLISGNRNTGFVLLAAKGTLERTVIRGTLYRLSDKEHGEGIYAAPHGQKGSAVEVTECLLHGNKTTGIIIFGSTAKVNRTVVRKTASRASDGWFGSGIIASTDWNSKNPSELTVTDSVVASNQYAGIVLQSSIGTIRRTVIMDTIPDSNSNQTGRGIDTVLSDGSTHPSTLAVTDSLVVNNRRVGIWFEGSKGTVERTVVSSTKPSLKPVDGGLEQRSVRDANDIDHLYERIDKEASA